MTLAYLMRVLLIALTIVLLTAPSKRCLRARSKVSYCLNRLVFISSTLFAAMIWCWTGLLGYVTVGSGLICGTNDR